MRQFWRHRRFSLFADWTRLSELQEKYVEERLLRGGSYGVAYFARGTGTTDFSVFPCRTAFQVVRRNVSSVKG